MEVPKSATKKEIEAINKEQYDAIGSMRAAAIRRGRMTYETLIEEINEYKTVAITTELEFSKKIEQLEIEEAIDCINRISFFHVSRIVEGQAKLPPDSDDDFVTIYSEILKCSIRIARIEKSDKERD